MAKNLLHCSFKSFVSLGKDEITDLITHLELKDLVPIKYGLSATRPKFEYNSLSKSDVAEVCISQGRIAIKGKVFVIELSVSEYFAKPLLQTLKIEVSKKTDLTFITTLVNDLFAMLRACYAFVDLNYNGDTYTSGRSIEDCLGGFSWVNIFGKPYIDLWGRDKFLNAPAFEVRDYDDFITVMIQETPFHTSKEVQAKSSELKRYFGLDCFYKFYLEKRKTSFNSIKEIIEYDLDNKKSIRYLAPDFHRYYNYQSNSKCMFLVQKEVLDKLDN
ncbi:hypothetical protein DP73_18060 [Desulfosporosinus sp. HMP52]|uniref:hypothetical protein n=1 Tax=Desulfosporosinus sp. HMP52 TaxID=1487923 RepID=UPI00051F9BC2|nr:hypothetical protein [Desulfosporosinus sp. HMP52]KGK85835.1 hypothetical protein DP73_18060 [Desulfosporosinus sp. HMP52]